MEEKLKTLISRLEALPTLTMFEEEESSLTLIQVVRKDNIKALIDSIHII